MRTFKEGCEHLRKLGFFPPTIVDVGVAWGTPDLYSTWAEAFLYLVEPVSYFHQGLEKLLERRPGTLLRYAAGAKADFARISVKDSSLGLAGASLTSARYGGQSEEWMDFEFPIERLDNLVARDDVPSGSLLKTDCQGFDHAVLAGASSILPNFEVLIVEAHVFRYAGSEDNGLGNIISLVGSHGYQLYDLLSPAYRNHDEALSQVDAVFVRCDSQLLRFKGY